MDFKDKRILVTGACGTVGDELIRQLLAEHQPAELIGIDNNESALFFLEGEFCRFANTSFYLADVRDRDKLCKMTKGVDVVFHTAAFKHVILSERSPFEAVQTNILGVQNIIYAAIENNVERVVFTSSDKAVNPTNVMGTSKLMGERLITAANSQIRDRGPLFTSTRFGNVLGSRGSVIPIFHRHIRNGGPVTLTDTGMTRFIMSLEQAVRLVIDSGKLCCGGEVFVTKMPAIRIEDLARVMIQELGPVYGHRPEDIKIDIIGSKPGEKMYEELLNFEETRRTWELDLYYAVLPAFSDIYRNIVYEYPNLQSQEVTQAYNSSNITCLSPEEVKEFLKNCNLLNPDSQLS